ncbi:MAG: SGNH/GDSL hydrolase family protein [Lentisphaeria bacterium]|nr:SGNH/GDSL hydrolase family protein [Lentisphaeria bacterium]
MILRKMVFQLTMLLTAGMTMSATAREGREWCHMWWENAHETKRPRVLLIGDSIVNGLNGVTRKELADVANVDLLASSKNISDPALMKEVGYMLGEYEYVVVYFNHGLHGWSIPVSEYEAHLQTHVKRLRALSGGAKLVWASITPLRDPNEARNKEIVAKNEIAARVMKENGIKIQDLHAFVLGHEEWRSDNKRDAYHYCGKGNQALGKKVAEFIRTLCGWTKK